MSRRPIVGGNWKCNPASASKLPELVANINSCDTSKCDVYVCPSPLHTSMVSFTNDAKIAPQNMNFTGCGVRKAPLVNLPAQSATCSGDGHT